MSAFPPDRFSKLCGFYKRLIQSRAGKDEAVILMFLYCVLGFVFAVLLHSLGLFWNEV